MKDLFEQATKSMEKTWDQWQKMVAKAPLWQEPEALSLSKWSSWIATTRSTYDVNMSVWKTFVEQSEETFFKMFKQSPLWNEQLESQMRDVWNGMKKAQETQHELINDQWEKMENLLKDAE